MSGFKIVDNVFYHLKRYTMVPAKREMCCAICLKEVSYTPPRKRFVKQLECTHCFHSKCINKWLKNHFTCPVCRNNNYSPIEQMPRGTFLMEPITDSHININRIVK